MTTQTSSGKIEVHGHRGSRGTHPENTLPAFQEAVDAKADVLEFDLQMTKDNVPVVAHDPLLTQEHCKGPNGRKLKKPIAIRTLTLEELKKYDCGSVPQERFPTQQQIPGTPIPTLEEVLVFVKKQAPHIKMNIETKMVPPSTKRVDLVPDPSFFVHQIVGLLQKYSLVEQSILQSFDFRTLQAAKEIEPKLQLSCLFEEKTDMCAETARVGAQWLSPKQTLLTPEIMKDCRSRGIRVVPWTANKTEEWARLVNLKVDAIITDYPRQLVQYFSGK